MPKDTVSFSDFQKLDLRVGRVAGAEVVEGSKNLIRMTVDLGKEYGERKVLAGISTWYKADDVIGKKFIFVANLEPKQMMKELSNGMMLCADMDEDVRIIQVDDQIPEGAVVR